MPSIKQLIGRPAVVVALCFLPSACSTDKKDPAPPPVVVYGTTTITNSKVGTDNGAYQLTSADVCSHNVDSGVVNVTLSQGAGKPSLQLAIKDFSSTPKVYTCKQAADNGTADASVGLKYETCMVQGAVPSSNGAASLNGYSMYRETVATKKFTYAGACTIDVSAAAPSIVGKVACTGMVQTTLEGAPRNPVDAAISADVAADFNCTFK